MRITPNGDMSSVIKPQYCAFFNHTKHQAFDFLSNFYMHPIQTPYGVFQCSEGLYQYLKCGQPLEHRDAFLQASGQQAYDLSRQLSPQVTQEQRISAMREALMYKFQDETLKHLLLETHDAYLVENAPLHHDVFWSDNGDGSGQNQLGIMLMQLREQWGGVGVVPRPRVLEQFYERSCMQCEKPIYFLNFNSFYTHCDEHRFNTKNPILYRDETMLYHLASSASFPTDYGLLTMSVFQHAYDLKEREAIAVYNVDLFDRDHDAVVVRVHDACATSELFHSHKCDCRHQLEQAMAYIAQHGGMVIYLPQEGRGIGLANKIAAYHLQETLGLDTVDANRHLGLPDDARTYDAVVDILKTLGVRAVKLMSNNPRKKEELEKMGVRIVDTLPCVVQPQSESMAHYQKTKGIRMRHTDLIDIPFDFDQYPTNP